MTAQAPLRKPLCFLTGSLTLAAVVTACVLMPVARAQVGPPDYSAIIAAPDRTDADLQTDKRRDPVKLLAFTAVRPGMKVLDMGAGGGYSTELMARAVAPNGVVYGLTGSLTFAAVVTACALMTVARAQVALPDYSAIIAAPDRTAALKSGGTLVIADHSARPGDGVAVGKSLHRIEESALRREVEAAGFKLVAQGDFWRHPEDPRDFSIQPPSGKAVDEFVLKFQKPM